MLNEQPRSIPYHTVATTSPYTPSEQKGFNTYLQQLLNPFKPVMPVFPDDNLTPRAWKDIYFNQAFDGAENYLVLIDPYVDNRVTVTVYAATNAYNPVWVQVANVVPDQAIGDKYESARAISAGFRIKSSTVSSGNFDISGQMFGALFNGFPAISGKNGQQLNAECFNESARVDNVGVMEGVSVIFPPPSDPYEFQSTARTNLTFTSGGFHQSWSYRPATGGGNPVTGQFLDPLYLASNNPAWVLTDAPWQDPITGIFYNATRIFQLDATTVNTQLPARMTGGTTITVTGSMTRQTALQTVDWSLRGFIILDVLDWGGNRSTFTFQPGDSVGDTGGMKGQDISLSAQCYTDFNIMQINVYYLWSAAMVDNGGLSTKLRMNVQLDNAGANSEDPVAAIVIQNVDPTQVFTLTGVINYEALPNDSLSRDVKTYTPPANEGDVQMARMALANAASLGIRFAMTTVEADAYYRGSKDFYRRDTLTGFAWGLKDLWSGIKKGYKFLAPVLKPAMDTLSEPYGFRASDLLAKVGLSQERKGYAMERKARVDNPITQRVREVTRQRKAERERFNTIKVARDKVTDIEDICPPPSPERKTKTLTLRPADVKALELKDSGEESEKPRRKVGFAMEPLTADERKELMELRALRSKLPAPSDEKLEPISPVALANLFNEYNRVKRARSQGVALAQGGHRELGAHSATFAIVDEDKTKASVAKLFLTVAPIAQDLYGHKVEYVRKGQKFHVDERLVDEALIDALTLAGYLSPERFWYITLSSEFTTVLDRSYELAEFALLNMLPDVAVLAGKIDSKFDVYNVAGYALKQSAALKFGMPLAGAFAPDEVEPGILGLKMKNVDAKGGESLLPFYPVDDIGQLNYVLLVLAHNQPKMEVPPAEERVRKAPVIQERAMKEETMTFLRAWDNKEIEADEKALSAGYADFVRAQLKKGRELDHFEQLRSYYNGNTMESTLRPFIMHTFNRFFSPGNKMLKEYQKKGKPTQVGEVKVHLKRAPKTTASPIVVEEEEVE